MAILTRAEYQQINNRHQITKDILRECFHYSPESGLFTWLDRPKEHFKTDHACSASNTKCKGKIAGKKRDNAVKLFGIYLRMDLLAWIYMHGEYPVEVVQIDGDSNNNKIYNLRPIEIGRCLYFASIKTASQITQGDLQECVYYDKQTGLFTWKHRPREHFATMRNWFATNSEFAGNEVTSSGSDGYIRIRLFGGIRIAGHRAAWLYEYGKLPSDQLDHIDGDRKNNRIENLREVNASENLRNMGLSKRNKSGFTGVKHRKHCVNLPWEASIRVNGEMLSLGSFSNIEDAIKARQQANIKYGYHKNHGKQRNWSRDAAV